MLRTNKLNEWAKKQFKSKTFIGLDITLSESGRIYHLIELHNKNNEIEIIKQLDASPTLEILAKSIDKNTPINLCINGRGVLHKQMPSYQNEDQILQQVLPNADASQFILQTVPTTDGIVASVIRKEIVLTICEELEQAGLWVLGCSLGSFDCLYLLPLLNGQLTINTPLQSLTFNEDRQLTGFESTPKEIITEIEIGEQKINTSHLNAYAAAFGGLIQIPSRLNIQLLHQNQEEFLHKKIFTYGSILSVAIILLCLLLNTGVYYFYKNKNQALGFSMLSSATKLSELDSLKDFVAKQNLLLNATSINQQTNTSYYADQIGASLPKELQLTEVSIFPLRGKERDYNKEDLKKYDRSNILIKGLCKNSLIYNSWIKELQDMKWVAKTNHLNYKDISENFAEFELQLILSASQ